MQIGDGGHDGNLGDKIADEQHVLPLYFQLSTFLHRISLNRLRAIPGNKHWSSAAYVNRQLEENNSYPQLGEFIFRV